jgi:PAS domain-containing protein
VRDRALVTFGVTGFQELLELALPGMREYADRHGYTLLHEPPLALTRPPSWHKITALLEALDEYEEALWLDCDVVIVDGSHDLADEIPAGAWQAITLHQTGEGDVPSAGVWYLRQGMQPVLEAIWRLDRHLHHRWWEQAALQELLGYTPDRLPVTRETETDLYRRTHWLDQDEWNRLYFGPGDLAGARFLHVGPGHPPGHRAQLMRELTARDRLAPTKGA